MKLTQELTQEISKEINEIKRDTNAMILITSLLTILGILLTYIDGPKFYNGLMVGFGFMMPFLSLWRKEALISKISIRLLNQLKNEQTETNESNQ